MLILLKQQLITDSTMFRGRTSGERALREEVPLQPAAPLAELKLN